MSIPFTIVVLADLAPNQPPEPPRTVAPGGCQQLMSELAPMFKLGDPQVELKLASLEDFTPAALCRGRRELEQSADKLTALIHHPRFQRLESAWRGLDFLARRLPESGVELKVLNTPADQVRQRFYEYVFKPAYDGLWANPPGLVLLDFDLDHKPASLQTIKDLAQMGESLAAPLAAQTNAGFFGMKHLVHVAAMGDAATRLAGPEYTAFQAFREKDRASWFSLFLNRFLLREPYRDLAYEEPAAADQPQSYLWGRAIWILGANAARAWGASGHPVGVSGIGGGEQAGLACRELPISRKEKLTTPLEAVFPQPVVEMLPYFGISPLTQLPAELSGGSEPGTVYLHLAANLRHFTDPTQARPGLLLVYATLAYSLILGRASNLALLKTPDLAGLSGDEAAEAMKEWLLLELGDMGRGEIEVTAGDGVLGIRLVPELLIHSKPFEVRLQAPLA